MVIGFDGSPREFYLDEGYIGAEGFGRHAGIYFIIDVWRCRLDLFAVIVGDHGVKRSYPVDPHLFGISPKDLLRAVEAAGGDLSKSGSYPISIEIEEKILAHPEAMACIDPPGECTDLDCPETELVVIKAFSVPSRPIMKGLLKDF